MELWTKFYCLDKIHNMKTKLLSSLEQADLSLEHKEYIKSVFSNIEKSLSDLEKKVLGLYLYGYSYKQIATALSVTEKSISNALCRVRNKLSK